MVSNNHENRVIVAGKLVDITDKEGSVQVKNNIYKFLITDKYNSLLNKDPTKEDLFIVIHGIIANMPEYDYIYPYNISVSTTEQVTAENAIIEGLVSDIYNNENRYRLFIHSSRNGKISKMFVTVFNNTYDDISFVKPGSRLLFIGKLSVYKKRISLLVDKIFSLYSNNTDSEVESKYEKSFVKNFDKPNNTTIKNQNTTVQESLDDTFLDESEFPF